MQSDAKTVADYLGALPEERRKTLEQLRAVILKNLPEGYEEAINWGHICYQVPLSIVPKTYNGQPLMFMALAAQKNNFAIYYCADDKQTVLTGLWANPKKKVDMGKGCLRFKALDDLNLKAIGQAVAACPVDKLRKAYGN